jgi:thioredoxin reductase (NADPH)
MPHLHNMVIIGGGPAGLTAAIYAGRAGLNPQVLMGEDLPGGQLTITTDVENFPGFPSGIGGPELMQRMQEQAEKFGAVLHYQNAHYVEVLVDQENGREYFNVQLSSAEGDVGLVAKSVIVATGNVAKWLDLEREDEFKNKGISACATCDGPLPCFAGKELFVVGGGDSAMEEALFLTMFAKHVTILVRGTTLAASAIMQDRAKAHSKITVRFSVQVDAYHGSDMLEAIDIRDRTTGQVETVQAGGLFMAIGHNPQTNFLRGSSTLGREQIVSLTPTGHIVVTDNVYTSRPGIFAAGDVHDNHYKQAVTAAGFGCMASIAAERWLSQQV